MISMLVLSPSSAEPAGYAERKETHVKRLIEQDHRALAASLNTGVDATAGHGLAEALAGAQVVVGASNSPSFGRSTGLCPTSSQCHLDHTAAISARSWPR